jgi:hypothetical protein
MGAQGPSRNLRTRSVDAFPSTLMLVVYVELLWQRIA